MTQALERIRGAMVGLKMPRALEALDHTMQKLEQGELTAIEAIDSLLSEEFSTRETRRIDVALKTSKLMPVKTLESFDFTFPLPGRCMRSMLPKGGHPWIANASQPWLSSTLSAVPKSYTF